MFVSRKKAVGSGKNSISAGCRGAAEFSCLWVVAAATKIIPKMETLAAANVTVFGI